MARHPGLPPPGLLRTVSHGASSVPLPIARSGALVRSLAAGPPGRDTRRGRHTTTPLVPARPAPPVPGRRGRGRSGPGSPASRAVDNRRTCGPDQIFSLDSSPAPSPVSSLVAAASAPAPASVVSVVSAVALGGLRRRSGRGGRFARLGGRGRGRGADRRRARLGRGSVGRRSAALGGCPGLGRGTGRASGRERLGVARLGRGDGVATLGRLPDELTRLVLDPLALGVLDPAAGFLLGELRLALDVDAPTRETRREHARSALPCRSRATAGSRER